MSKVVGRGAGQGSQNLDTWNNTPSAADPGLTVTDEALAELCDAIADYRCRNLGPDVRVGVQAALRMRAAAEHHRNKRLHWSGRW